MKPARIRALTRRIVEQFRRDPRTLALLFVVPVVITAMLGWILRDQSQPVTRAVIVNVDGSGSARFAGALATAASAAGIQIVEGAADDAAARGLIKDDRADVAVVIPAGFAGAVASGGAAAIIIETPGLNPGEDGARIAALQPVLASTLAALAPAGFSPQPPTVTHVTVFGSADADTLDLLAPVFIGYFAYFFVFLLTGVSFLRERIGGTLERLLATPITRGEIVVGYSLGFSIFATLQVAVLLAFSLMDLSIPAIGPLPAFHIGLAVPCAGSPLLAFLITLVLALGAVSLGIFLSTFARNELQVIQFIPIVIVPQALLAGIFWPVDSLPAALQPIAHLMPLTYAVEGLREVILAGATLASATIQLDLAVLAAIAAFFVILASGTIRREVA